MDVEAYQKLPLNNGNLWSAQNNEDPRSNCVDRWSTMIAHWHKLTNGRSNPKTKAISDKGLITYRKVFPPVKESAQVLGHDEKHKTIWKLPILSEGGSRAKTSRISEGLQVVRGFDWVLLDAIHWVTRIQWMRDKISHITRVKVMLLTHAIWMETVGSRSSRSTAKRWSDGWMDSTGKYAKSYKIWGLALLMSWQRNQFQGQSWSNRNNDRSKRTNTQFMRKQVATSSWSVT